MKQHSSDHTETIKDAKQREGRFEDPVEATGCSAENDAVLLCFAEHHDWRKCQPELEAFKACFEEFKERRAEERTAKLKRAIEEAVREVIADLDDKAKSTADGAASDPESVSSIPFSTEQ